jgi:hypothetical protein
VRRENLAAVSVAVALAVVIAACSGGGEKQSHRAITITSVNVPVTVVHGAVVHLSDATPVIPPGAVSANGRIEARTSGSAITADLGLAGSPGATRPVFISAGQPISFELTGATLLRPATLTLPCEFGGLRPGC